MSPSTALAQLRHLYKQMLDGDVRDTAEAARGLLGPVIEALEPLVAEDETVSLESLQLHHGASPAEMDRRIERSRERLAAAAAPKPRPRPRLLPRKP